MAERKAEAVWQGGLRGGTGTMRLESGAYEGKYSFATRFEEEPGANPEELIGAAHAGCFSMALAGELEKAGYTPGRIHTEATVTLGKVDGKSRITKIHLDTEVSAPDIPEQKFQEIAEGAKTGCPVSAALKAVEIGMTARLLR